jgi:hypothetical protein
MRAVSESRAAREEAPVGFRKDETGVAQTAANTAATLVAAAMTAGVITDVAEARAEFDAIRAATFADLALVVKADNALFASVEAAAPAAKPSGKASSGGGKGNYDNASVVIEYGALKGKGKTVAETYALSAAEFSALTDGGYTKSGAEYIEWMTGNDKNPFMQKVANGFLEGIRAGSDA